MNKKLRIVLVLILVAVGVSSWFLYKKVTTPQKVHYHAGFVIFQNNKKLDFSNNKYMYIKPCTVKDTDEQENDQLEKAHLHDTIGDVVHIERTGALWKDLFTNIHYPVDYTQTTGYINGKRVKNYQSQTIQPDDTLAIFIGTNDINKDLQQIPTKTYIEKMAKKSTTCGD